MTKATHDDETTATLDGLVHRLVDGELDETGRRRLAKLAASSGDRDGVRERVETLVAVRSLVREASARPDDEIPSSDLFAAIEGAIARGEGGTDPFAPMPSREGAERARPALRVLRGGLAEPGARRDDTPIHSPIVDATPSAGHPAARRDPSVRTERESRSSLSPPADPVRRRALVGAVVGVLAVAAALVIVVFQPLSVFQTGETATTGETTSVAAHDPPVTAPVETEMAAAAADALGHTEVISVDFGENTGTVFSVEGREGERFAVVWLSEEAEHAFPDGKPMADPALIPHFDDLPSEATP